MAFKAASNSYQFVIAAKDATKGAFDSVDKNVQQVGDSIGGVATKARMLAGPAAMGIAAFGTAAAGSLGAITIAAASAANDIDYLSSVAGVGAERFQELTHGASQYNIEQDKLSDILKDVNDKVGDFLQTGGGPMKDFFENIAPQVGVTADQFRNLNSADALQLYVSSLEQANLSQSEMTFYMEAIANDATALLPLLKDNGAAMNAQAEEARALGIALSDIEVTTLSQLDKQITKNKNAFDGFMNKLGAEFAPVIMAVSNEILNAAKEAGGFGEIATKVFDVVVKGAGYAANFVRGLHVVFFGVKTIAAGVAEGVVEVFSTIESGYRQLANLIPGVEVSATSSLHELHQSLVSTRQGFEQELQDLAMTPMPAEGIEQWVANVKSKAEEAAISLNLQSPDSASGEDGGEAGEDPEVAAAKARIEQLKMLKELQATTDLENEELAHLNRMELLRVNFEEGEIPTLESFNEIKAGLEQKYQDKVTKISNEGAWRRAQFEKKTMAGQAKQVFGQLANITAGVAQHNKGLFKLNQAAGIANAIINTAQGVTRALAEYPPPISFAMAAAQLAAGLVQINTIRSQKFGSGGSVSAGGGGSVAVGAQPVTNAPSNIANNQIQNEKEKETVNVYHFNIDPDATYSGKAVIQMQEKIAELEGYGVRNTA